MRVLVTGAGGLLAAAIIREFEEAGDTVVALDRAALDVINQNRVQRTVADARPDLLINCAAYNNVDGAEGDPTSALGLNTFAVRTMARVTRKLGSGFVHYGSDFVFDGAQSRPYTEDDPANPRSTYGMSKLLGEWFALENPQAYVLRVESLFGEPGPCGSRSGSLQGILERIRSGDMTPVFVDRTVTLGYTTDIAAATRLLITRRIPAGLYHCVNSGAASWAEIAAEAARLLGLPLHMNPITLDSVQLRAKRPKYSALSNARLAAAGIAMPTWQDALARHLGYEPGPAPPGQRGR